MHKNRSAKSGRLARSEALKKPGGKALRLHGIIARKLGVLIVSGKYRPGDLLRGEISSSAQLAVSRTAYREAVRILAAKGLVDAAAAELKRLEDEHELVSLRLRDVHRGGGAG